MSAHGTKVITEYLKEMSKTKNVIEQDYYLDRSDRQNLLGQKSALLWFTGLSGSGKSTIANEVSKTLHEKGCLNYVLDGDNIRLGINKDLGFTSEDRSENLRRIAEIGKLFIDAGVICIAAFVSPEIKQREAVKNIVGENDFIEIFVDTPLATCESRDVKGLYKKARKGEIKNFTGISAPYEKPVNPDIIISTEGKSPQDCARKILELIAERLTL